MVDEKPTMSGRVCLVTGVTSGIGRETALALARRGATVLAVARDRRRGEAVAAELAGTGAPAELLVADLSSRAEVRRLAGEVAARHHRLHVLVNNAGLSKFERCTTVDGLEETFATNHLAPFLLTNLLLDLLRASAPARVVTVSSETHRHVGGIPWDDLQGERRFEPLKAYGVSKLMNVLFTCELARRLEGSGVTANCLSPGFARTGLGREAKGPFRLVLTLGRPFMVSAEQASRTSVHLAADPEVAGVSGRYFKKGVPAESSEASRDREAAERLWALSERLCGLVASAA